MKFTHFTTNSFDIKDNLLKEGLKDSCLGNLT